MTPLILPTFRKWGMALLVKPFEMTSEPWKSEGIRCVFNFVKSAVKCVHVMLKILASGTGPTPLLFEALFQQKVLILKPGYPHFFWSHFWKTLAELLPHFHFVHFWSPKCSKKKWGYPTFIWAILSCFREGVRAHIFSWFRVRYHTKVKDAKSTTNFFSFAHARRQFDCTHQEGHTPLSESG